MSNLIVPSSEQARENGSKGGKKRAENARKRKALKQQLELFLQLPVKDENMKNIIEQLGLNPNDIDNQMAITIALCQKALKGDTKAYEVIRDTIGEKPQDNINLSGNVDTNSPYKDLSIEELREIIRQGSGSDG